ncbi:MAG: M20/M25/M40 family metallo-hydrolase [Actinobacteria bacterium]|nr:M20/M25/M40 family metallo-hydrolase [Actinomycetota bacterium]
MTTFIDHEWELALPVLQEYIAIPARSPMFDPDWETTGHIQRAAELLRDWASARSIPGLVVELVQVPGLTPVLLVEVPATHADLADRTVLMYGHLDKQPEMEPWAPGLGPWLPVLRGDRLYGRGGADDGYSVFAALTAIAAVHEQGGRHARVVVLIEASEESSSVHLADHLQRLLPRIGVADLVVTLDSFCESYDRLWTTTSTRGVCGGVLDIEVCADDPHSGRASGVLPSSFRILRELLDRVEDSATGRLLLSSANVQIPEHRIAEAAVAAAAFPALSSSFRPVDGVQPMGADAHEELVNETWRPALEVIGVDGLPPVADAGNVFRSRLSVKLSLRLPPTADTWAVGEEMKAVLEAQPPHGARVTLRDGARGPGWESPAFTPWLAQAAAEASMQHWGMPVASCGVGGTIPFMGMLGEQMPDAQFLLVGVLGPESNAHGPNEFLHLPTVRRVTAAVAEVLRAHAAHCSSGNT